jgi:hypothetical protein
MSEEVLVFIDEQLSGKATLIVFSNQGFFFGGALI